MKIERIAALYTPWLPRMQCPLCHRSLALDAPGHSLMCEDGHCFDLSAKGYVNFVPNQAQRQTKYDKALFESRGHILAQGFYAPVADALRTLAAQYAPGPLLLDAGCGEGYYTRFLSQGGAFEPAGMDLEKEAVALACRGGAATPFLAADINRLPFKGHSLHAVLNILTPACYPEFQRVLAPGGVVLKVIPGEDYLREIRAGLGGAAGYSNARVAAHFEENLRLAKRVRIRYTRPLSALQAADFLRMTPLSFSGSAQRIAPEALDEITIDLELLVGTTL
ncbi:methyltransferase domain-containing protein [Christensenellaceae bacterium NSJ-44]|uniref:Methyltransferase domain-containing protein n=1 Tax=Luoshenia tenuis TaxID=2763654 RepID=A0A926CZA9_9FIRM|nr:methyltransferase domain-containing protein [Luoshenia tenuis]MBC8528358.1 methyltransferase domain-containing protein [Luoshenia tenuis]